MADLGSIDYTDVNRGTTRIDRSGEVAALGNFLNAGKKIIDESVKAKVTGDMLESIDPADQGETPGADSQEHTVPIERAGSDQTIYPEGSAEAAVSVEIDRLNAVIEQGNTSQAKLAEMRIKQVLADAQNKFPWLYDDLRARAGAVMAGSVKLDQLAMADAVASEAADFATKQRQAITDEAYGLWEDGGLGIPVWIKPDDPRFAREFVERREIRNIEQDAAMQSGLFLAQQSLAAKDKLGQVQESLQGRHSWIRYINQQLVDDYGVGELLNELKRGDSADFNRIEELRGRLPEALAAIQKEKASLIYHFNETVDPQFRDTPYFKALKAQQEDVIAELDLYATTFRQLQDDIPDVAEFLQTNMLIRGADFGRRLPTPLQDWTAFANTPGGEFTLQMVADSKTATGLTLMNDVTEAYASSMSQLYPDFFGPDSDPANKRALAFRTSGSLGITPSTTPEQINTTIRGHQRDSTQPFMVKTYGIDDEIDVSTKTAAMWFDSWTNNLEDIPENAHAGAAGNYLTGLNYSLAHQVDLGQTREEPVEIIMQGLASEGMENAIQATRDQHANERLAFGRTAKEWYTTYAQPTDRRERVGMEYRTKRIGGLILADAVAIDLDATRGEDGGLVYKVDANKVQEEANRRFQLAAVDAMDQVGTQRSPSYYYQKVEAEIADAMEPIVREVETQIAIEMNLRKASAPANAADPDINNFQAYFTGDIEPGIRSPWVSLFRYTSETGVQ